MNNPISDHDLHVMREIAKMGTGNSVLSFVRTMGGRNTELPNANKFLETFTSDTILALLNEINRLKSERGRIHAGVFAALHSKQQSLDKRYGCDKSILDALRDLEDAICEVMA